MNNNNLYNTNNFIGITHNDYFKTTSNALATAIHTLDLNSSNYTCNVSNILDNKITDVDINLSNYIENTSNAILARYDPMIIEKIEHITIPIEYDFKHTYINNSNLLGEIRFWCKSTADFPVIIPVGIPDYRVKIDVDGKLKIYYTYDPAINLTFGNGWIDVGNSIVGLNASDANIGISISGLEAQILAFNNKLDAAAKELINEFYQRLDMTPEEADFILTQVRNAGYYTPSGYIGEFSSFTTSIAQFLQTGSVSFVESAFTNISLIIAQNPLSAFFLGVGGIGFAAAAAAIQDLAYVDVITSQLYNQIESNINISTSEKTELKVLTNTNKIYRITEYCSNMSNLSLSQGFINRYNTNQQTIPSLLTSSLNLNSGNITSINTINASTGIYGTLATTNNTNLGLPTKSSFGGSGDKIILSTGSSTTYPSSIGMNTNDMWLSTNSNLRFYNNGSNSLSLTSNFITSNYDLTCHGQIKENNNYLSNIYATSNVVKSITTYDTPQLIKHFAFYCSTTNVIYPNSGNTAYYAYHLDLRNYTKTGYIQIGGGSNDPYRIFKINCFFATNYYQKLTSGIPDIIDYTIYMSNKANAAGNGTIAGLNIMATGIPQSYFLDTIPPNNLFLMRNVSNNFDYISIVTTGLADIRVIITCMLS